MSGPRVAVAHDYLTQRGGAERVALTIARAFPGAPLLTSLLHPEGTYPEVADHEVVTSFLQRSRWLRAHHRAALPLYPTAFGRLRPPTPVDVVVASTSGWAHGIGGDAPVVVYSHTPARWLYREGEFAPSPPARAGLAVLGPPLRRWDRRRARSAVHTFANSRATAARIAAVHGVEAEVLPPPPGLDASGPRSPVAGLEAGFVLTVARLLPYKHVDLVVAAAAALPDRQVVVVGDGPERERLAAAAGTNVRLLPVVTDAELRWLYAHAAVLAAPAEEDYGLTPVEAAAFGVPTVARRAGGHLETVQHEVTGLLVEDPTAATLAAAVRAAAGARWSAEALTAVADAHAEPRFTARLRAAVESAAR